MLEPLSYVENECNKFELKWIVRNEIATKLGGIGISIPSKDIALGTIT